jgi:hypothetical protein
MGFINDQHHLAPAFVLGEQGTVESMGQLDRVIDALLESQLPADHL